MSFVELLCKEEVYKIIDVAIEVHKEQGSGFLESVYEVAMVLESKNAEIPFQTQIRIPVHYKEIFLEKEFIADYIGFEKVLVEFKCSPRLTKIEEAQIINYLKATGLSVGLLINFGSQQKLEWKRYVRTEKT